MEKGLFLTIKKLYFEQILSGEKKIEYRKNSAFFQTRLKKKPNKLFLICGPKRMAIAEITMVKLIDKPDFLKDFDFLPTPKVFAIHIKNPKMYYTKKEIKNSELNQRRKKA